MSGVDYHAWTHRPKAQGGTDPLELTSELPWARIERGYDLADQTIGNNTNVTINGYNHVYNMGAGESGLDAFTDSTGSNLGLRVDVPGVYLVKVGLDWTSGSVGTFVFGFSKNSSFLHRDTATMIGSVTYYEKTFLAHLTGTAGAPDEQLRISVYQNSGVGKDIDMCFLHAVRLGDYTGDTWQDIQLVGGSEA